MDICVQSGWVVIVYVYHNLNAEKFRHCVIRLIMLEF